MENMIQQVLYTLNQIEVRGRENIDRMLGCMFALERVAEALKQNRETLGEARQDSPDGVNSLAAQQTARQEGGTDQ